MMRDLRLRCILLAITVASLFAGSALAQGTASLKSEIDSLKAKFIFVKKLDARYPDSGFGGTWALLENDASRLSGEHGEVSEFAVIHQDVLLSWAKVLEDREQPEQALSQYSRLITEYGNSAKGYTSAAKASAGIHRDLAETATDEPGKLRHLQSAKSLYEAIGDDRSANALRDTIIDLRSRVGIQFAKERKYQEAFDELSTLERESGGTLGTGEAAKALRFLREKTGVLAVRFVTVKAEGTDITKGAVLRFEPKGGGRATETPVREQTRWEIGEYELKLVLPGQPKPILSLRATLRPSGTSIELPSVVPDGMTWVPAGGDVARPFFIDRTEVTIVAIRKVNPDYRAARSAWDKSNFPAHKVTWQEARVYASSVGKQLPTKAQWLRAAFAGKRQKYPWGDSGPRGFCNIGTGAPTVVGAYPDGASDCGALDMAGNVWEWLRDGWAIGGSFGYPKLEAKVPATGAPWQADFLRDPKPSQGLYNDPKKVQQRKYSKYRVNDANLEEVGFRCVIEL
jgi:hypothetical protein